MLRSGFMFFIALALTILAYYMKVRYPVLETFMIPLYLITGVLGVVFSAFILIMLKNENAKAKTEKNKKDSEE